MEADETHAPQTGDFITLYKSGLLTEYTATVGGKLVEKLRDSAMPFPTDHCLSTKRS
jgi:hypothetical protein